MSIRSLWIGTIAAVAAFGAVTTANAIVIEVAPGDTAVVTSSNDLVISDNGFVSVDILDVFTFTNAIGSDSVLNFSIDAFVSTGNPFGVANLEFVFVSSAGIQVFAGITSASGMIFPDPFLLAALFPSFGDTVLTVTGEIVGGTGGYDFVASVVPLPPALLLFGTALGGMGWLSRRRKASATA